jgi:8-oxo-dGTP pyrophosphatase MutT (NUDIX family)
MKPTSLSAGVVVVHRKAQTWRYLLLRCYRYWDFPKGQLEPGETPLMAACRETREETTLDRLDFCWGQPFCETAPYGRGKVARYYVAASDDDAVALPVSAELGRAEHDEFRWLPYDAARAMLPARLLPVIDWAHTLTGC